MNLIIKELEFLKNSINEILNKFENNIENIYQLDEYNKQLIKLEGKILENLDTLKTFIIKDDRIPSNKREEYLQNQLKLIDIDLSKLRSKRITLYSSNKSFIKENNNINTNIKDLLFKDIKNPKKINENTSSKEFASEVTNRLTKTQSLIQEQIYSSSQSVELIKDSTMLLEDVNSQTQNLNSFQRKAEMALKRLKIAQNWDIWLLKFSILCFILAVIYVIFKKIKNNLIIKLFFKIFKFGFNKINQKNITLK